MTAAHETPEADASSPLNALREVKTASDMKSSYSIVIKKINRAFSGRKAREG
jgi:hypothetical protein